MCIYISLSLSQSLWWLINHHMFGRLNQRTSGNQTWQWKIPYSWLVHLTTPFIVVFQLPRLKKRKQQKIPMFSRFLKLNPVWLVVSIPLKNMSSSDWIIIPAIGENKKCSKPPTSRWFVSIETPSWQYSHKWFTHYKWPFSIAMLNYQRVNPVESSSATGPSCGQVASLTIDQGEESKGTRSCLDLLLGFVWAFIQWDWDD